MCPWSYVVPIDFSMALLYPNVTSSIGKDKEVHDEHVLHLTFQIVNCQGMLVLVVLRSLTLNAMAKCAGCLVVSNPWHSAS